MFWIFLGTFFLIKFVVMVVRVRREQRFYRKVSARAQTEARETADAFAAWEAGARATVDSNLWLLGLNNYPRTLAELKQARRKAMFKAHPDRGGKDSDAISINNAFAEISRRYAA